MKSTYLDQSKLKDFQKEFLSRFVVNGEFSQQTEYKLPNKYRLLVEFETGYIFNNLTKEAK